MFSSNKGISNRGGFSSKKKKKEDPECNFSFWERALLKRKHREGGTGLQRKKPESVITDLQNKNDAPSGCHPGTLTAPWAAAFPAQRFGSTQGQALWGRSRVLPLTGCSYGLVEQHGTSALAEGLRLTHHTGTTGENHPEHRPHRRTLQQLSKLL